MIVDAPVANTAIAAIAATCSIEADEIQPHFGLDDLGLGSMGLIAVISRIEATYECEFSPDDVVSFLETQNVGEFTSLASKVVERIRTSATAR
jgi:acyl carrier protein